MKKAVPDKPTTNSESPWHGDFKSGVGYALGSSATETVRICHTFINKIFCLTLKDVRMAEWLAHWSHNLTDSGLNPLQDEFLFFKKNDFFPI